MCQHIKMKPGFFGEMDKWGEVGESVELSRLGGMFAIKCALPRNIIFEGQNQQNRASDKLWTV